MTTTGTVPMMIRVWVWIVIGLMMGGPNHDSKHHCNAFVINSHDGMIGIQSFVDKNSGKKDILQQKQPRLKRRILERHISSTNEDGTGTTVVAEALGYLVGAGSLILYTPIAVRIYRQKDASGLVLTTWWLKLISYTFSDVYAISHEYPISTYIETLIITCQAFIVLILTSYYQNQAQQLIAQTNDDDNEQRRNITQQQLINDENKLVWHMAFYLSFFSFLLYTSQTSEVSDVIIACGQAGSAVLNVLALLPQFQQNYQTKSSGDYSPITAGLASIGCTIRLFTTVTLADSDPLLLGTYGIALFFNASLFFQILYYDLFVANRSFTTIFLSDIRPPPPTTTNTTTTTPTIT